MAKEEETALVKSEPNELEQYIPTAMLGGAKSERIQELIAENLGDQQLQLSDLTRIKIPAGGAIQFEIPNATTGEPDYSKTIEGVIIVKKMSKAYWAEAFSGAGNPPDCRSNDMVHGIGTPGILCQRCPNNEYGSATNGSEGKACKDLQFIFFYAKNSMFPQLIVAPPTSLKALKQYFVGLMNEDKMPYEVVTRLALRKEKSKGGIDYASLVPSYVCDLSDEQARTAKTFGIQFGLMLNVAANNIVDSGQAFDADEEVI